MYCKIVYDVNGEPDSIVSANASVKGREKRFCYKGRSRLKNIASQPTHLQNGLFFKHTKIINEEHRKDDETFLGISTNLKIVSMDPQYHPREDERWVAEGYALDKHGDFRLCVVNEFGTLFGAANHHSLLPNIKVDQYFRVFRIESCRAGEEALRNYGSWADAYFEASLVSVTACKRLWTYSISATNQYFRNERVLMIICPHVLLKKKKIPHIGNCEFHVPFFKYKKMYVDSLVLSCFEIKRSSLGLIVSEFDFFFINIMC